MLPTSLCAPYQPSWALGVIRAAYLPVAVPGWGVPAAGSHSSASGRHDSLGRGGTRTLQASDPWPRSSTVPPGGGDGQARTDKPASPVQAAGRSIPNPPGANKGQVFVRGPRGQWLDPSPKAVTGCRLLPSILLLPLGPPSTSRKDILFSFALWQPGGPVGHPRALGTLFDCMGLLKTFLLL